MRREGQNKALGWSQRWEEPWCDDLMEGTLGTSDEDGAAGGGDPSGAEQTWSQGDTADLEGHSGASLV